jgi:hypothetical protein
LKYESLGDEMVDTRDSKSCATKCGVLNPFQNTLLYVVGKIIIPSRKWNGNRIVSIFNL